MDYGTCCEEARNAISGSWEKLIRKEDNGVWYLTIGFVKQNPGIGWLDSAIIYCPFCGTKVQDKSEIRNMSKDKN